MEDDTHLVDVTRAQPRRFGARPRSCLVENPGFDLCSTLHRQRRDTAYSHINRQGVSRSARIPVAVPLWGHADSHHVSHNLPCYVVPLEERWVWKESVR